MLKMFFLKMEDPLYLTVTGENRIKAAFQQSLGSIVSTVVFIMLAKKLCRLRNSFTLASLKMLMIALQITKNFPIGKRI